ncbi:MAG: MSMEG_0565 family glycosyltransferase [Cyanobacteria bacterium J06621_8]
MKKKLKIALFTYSTKPRGGVIHTIELAEALHAEGHQVCIYALNKDNVGFHRPLNCPSKLVPTQPIIETDKLRQKQQGLDPVDELIKQRIQEFIDFLSMEITEYDIYHAQDCISSNALKVLRDQEIIPHFIRTVHHIDQFNSPYLQKCHDRSIIEPDLCLCVAQYWQQELKKQYHVDAPVIFNGVDLARFSNQANGKEIKLRQKLGISNYPVYLTIGGIEPRKNSLNLLQAFIRALNTYPAAQLIIAGGETLFDYEPYRIEFFNLVKEHNITIGKSLILPGVIADQYLPTLYRCADAFVFPSIKEGWGLVLLEAIASGLPIITSNILPFTEFLDRNSALLVNPNSIPEITDAMVNILNKNLSQKLINNASLLPPQYSWQKSAQLHLKQYSWLLSNTYNNSI